MTNIEKRRDLIKILFEKGISDSSLVPLYGISNDDDDKNDDCLCNKKGDCPSKGKHPIFSKKRYSLLSYKSKEKYIFNNKKYYNLGIYCGSLAFVDQNKSLVVVDIDDKNYFSSQIMKDIELYDSDKIDTFQYVTGSGNGMHLWFWFDNTNVKINNSVKTIYQNVDIRSDGGLVVIPTSVTKQNLSYDFICDTDVSKPILELPKFLLESILNHQTSLDIKKPKTAIKRHSDGIKQDNKNINVYFPKNIHEIRREVIEKQAIKIPNGIRNITLFKLLSQDRRAGTDKQTEKQLYKQAEVYRDLYCEDSASLSNKELFSIVHSAFKSNKPMKMISLSKMTYKDLSHNYFIWMNNNRNIRFSEDSKNNMIKNDNEFFKALKERDFDNDKDEYVSLQYISDTRDLFMQYHGHTAYFRYPLKHLAKKMEDFGFVRKRTAKGNLWKVYIPNEIKENNKLVFDKKLKTSYDTTKQIQNKVNFITMTTASTPSSTTNNASSNTPAPQNSAIPVWATKDKPVFFFDQKIPDLTVDPNAIPWFTPPGFKDEQKTTYGDYVTHDEETKYCQFGIPRRSYIELNQKYFDFIDSLTPTESTDFENQNFIRDEAGTALIFDSIKEGQIIGCMIQSDPVSTYALEVLKIFQGQDILACRLWNSHKEYSKYNKYPREITNTDETLIANKGLMFVTFQDISYSITMNNFDILYDMKSEQDIEDEKNRIKQKNPNLTERGLKQYYDKITLFKPYGFDGMKKEYNMIIRYRIADGFPGHVPDDQIMEQGETAYQSFLEEHREKFDKANEEAAKKMQEKLDKLTKIKEDIKAGL